GERLSDLHLPIRLGGDLGLFIGVGKHLLEADERDGGVIDHAFVTEHCEGFEEYAAHVRAVPWAEIETATGLTEAQVGARWAGGPASPRGGRTGATAA